MSESVKAIDAALDFIEIHSRSFVSEAIVWNESDSSKIIAHYSTFEEISRELKSRGLGYEKWETLGCKINFSHDDIFKYYEKQIDEIMQRFNFKTNDIISITPSSQKKQAFRKKFLDEHIHIDDEVRYFVDGSGCFYIHLAERSEVIRVECCKGHLLIVPANTKHWFDMGPRPYFKMIRFFGIEEGWVAKYTKDDISSKFPLYDNYES
eukprot:UN04638